MTPTTPASELWDGPNDPYGDVVPPGTGQRRYVREPDIAAFEAELRANGWVDGDAKRDVSEGFMPYLTYLYRPIWAMRRHEQGYYVRVEPPQHQYLSLVTYDGAFVEAVLHVYAQPFNPRAKQRQPLLSGHILRTLDEIGAAASVIHPPLKP